MLSEDWRTVYELFVLDVYKFLLYFTGNREEAKDLTQETFIKAYNKWSYYDSHQSGVKTWLLTIARNLAIDRKRKQKRFAMIYPLLHKEPMSASEIPEESLNISESKRELYNVIQSLKPNYRSVVILRGIQEHSTEETALILGWTQNRVNVMFHRATKTLYERLSSEWR